MKKHIVLVLCSIVFSACGSKGNSANIVGGDSPSIPVSLDDAWTAVAPNGSEKVQISDSRYFIPPSVIQAVVGSYAGSNPAQFLHARILIGSAQCEYQSTGSNDVTLTLGTCSGGITTHTLLAAGTIIELSNYDAPGYIVEANFTLTK